MRSKFTLYTLCYYGEFFALKDPYPISENVEVIGMEDMFREIGV